MTHGIAAGHALTVQAGAEVLSDGGSAADAAIASVCTAFVCEPVLASPAGGGFAMVWDGRRASCLDFFVHTPKKPTGPRHDGLTEIEADFGGVLQTFHIGPGSVATPGMLPGLFSLHERYGRLPMKRLAEFAVETAKTGITISPFQARLGQIVGPILLATDAAKQIHAPQGSLLQAGDALNNPNLADALDAISREGLRIATHGEIANLMAEASSGGHLSREDLSSYQPLWREPLKRAASPKGGSKPSEIALNPPPSAGGGLIDALLSAYDENERYDPLRFATSLDQVDRRWRELGKPMGFDHRMLAQQPAALASRGTTHISVIDGEGTAIALTVSNGEGNGQIVPGCGFILNNMLGEDDLLSDGPGSWQPDQRLASMMAPSIVSDANGALLALGSGGSNRIRSALSQVLIRRLLGNEPIEEAVRAPRLHVEKGHLDVEPGLDPEPLQRAFEDHRIWDAQSMFFGGVHAVERVVNADGRFSIEGTGDDRRDGAFQIV
ncbi:MAG: gamma-glutamyltransferase [Pseudomonadota bacterium]